jgi:hypothetical protein
MSFPISSTFHVVLLVHGCPECLLSSTDTQPALKRECHPKNPLSGLKNVLQEPRNAIQELW